MKRKSVAIAVIAFVILACVALTACFGTSSSNSGSSTGRKIRVNIYECNGMGYTANDFVTNDLKLTKPTTEPTKEGYVFDGWYLDEERTIALVVGQKISDDDDSVSIYPKWTVATLQVKVIDELNGNEVYTVNYGETIDLGEPTKPFGYVFGGYFTDEERTKAFDTNTKIKAETILYIKWVGEEYDINYVMNGGEFDEDEEVSTKYTAGAEVQLPVAQKSGYIFDGWCFEEDLSDESITSFSGTSGDKTLYAKYVCDLANITIITGVSAKNGDVYSFETDYTAHSVNIFNYFTFSDNANVKVYDENGDLLNAEAIAFEENDGIGTIERTFSIVVVSESGRTEHEYSVVAKQHDESTVFVYYIVDGETKHTDSMYVGSVVTNDYSCDDEKEGYAFAYWSEEENGENAYVFGKIILNNDPITLYAVFKPVKYTVTYSLGAAINDEDNPAEYTIASDITLEEPTVPNGYTFVGWFTNDEYETKVNKLGGTTGDVTLYAQYAKAEKWNFVKTGDKYEVTAEEYPDLLDYLVFSRETEVEVHITSGYASTGEGFVTAAKGDVAIGHTTKASYTADGDEADITLTFDYTIINPTGKTDSGTYEQIPFIYMVNVETGLGNAFADFPIDHIGAELTVRDSEQLFFALENGYRPVCEAGSVAETLYDEMKNILREILDPGMTEKEICVAVAQYLVDTIEYDNEVLELFVAASTAEERKTLAGYRSFYLEGAILDGVAVCDGISKAFTSLTRIMGIESYQVSGRLSGVNHAWNKVFVDLDGNGTKEWTAVDCTGANTALGRGEEKETVEIMNYFYIFATDDFLVAQGYEYADEWDGKFVVVVDYNIYDAFEYDTEKTYYVKTKNALNDIMEFYKDEFDATEESALSISIRMPKTLGMDGNEISSNVVEALQQAMFTVDKNHTTWSCTIVDTNDVVITFFIEK